MFHPALSAQQKKLQEEILQFSKEELGISLRLDIPEGFSRDRWNKAGEIKLQGLSIPVEYGGRGLGALDTFIALEALGYGCNDNGLNFSICAHLLACAMPLALFGDSWMKEKYLPALCNGTLIAANGMTEPNTGSDAFAMQTIAIEKGEEFEITGSKSFVSNGPVADVIMLYAATDIQKGFMGGVTGFWIDKSLHPYSVSFPLEKCGLHASLLSSLYMEQMRVHRSFVIGPVGRGALVFNKSMEWERACLGAVQLGNLTRLLDDVTQVFRNKNIRSSVDASIVKKIAEITVQLQEKKLLAYTNAWKMDHHKAQPRDASVSKVMISEFYKSATLQIAQLYGMMNLSNADAELSVCDAIASTIYSGTSEMQWHIIAQSLGLNKI